MNKVYPSKRDGWLVAVIWGGALVMLAAAVPLLKMPAPLMVRICGPVLPVLLALFMLWTLYGTYYVLTQETLLIRSGPFRWTVPLNLITEVLPTRNPLSSPACSLDRLSVQYGAGNSSIMISPDDKTGFLQDLVASTHGLMLENGRVFPTR